MRLRELAVKIDAKPLSDADIEIEGVGGIDSVKQGYLTFIASNKLIPQLRASSAAAVIVKEPVPGIDIPQLAAENPLLAFARALEVFYVQPHRPEGVMSGATVSESVRLGRDVTVYPMSFLAGGVAVGDRTVVYPGVFIGKGSSLGEDCIVHPNVTIREGVTIGSRVIIHPGAVIGSDGFGYVFSDGRHRKIPQVGGVIVGDDVEIGASVTIDRATTGNTIIGEGTKIDNLVQVGHNVSIGKHCIIVAQVGIGGSTEIGNYVTLAGQVGVSDHVQIEDGCVVGAMSGVVGRLQKGTYSGIPVMPHFKWLRVRALYEKLPELQKKIKEIEEKIGNAEKGGRDD
ncbi:UDP-3-O-[3-hydroxymyristoyl] glucosamine N-acyltransferase [hydrothermal vent metagenome]|uniref:UDP-3-O-[3-hydroxymyristoyl] glucosamine N-acyltransferase n=1 Tax=hydrothermal vent metagenome TaxID=652676 RepID=A0A3B1DAM8_9ZZZZ